MGVAVVHVDPVGGNDGADSLADDHRSGEVGRGEYRHEFLPSPSPDEVLGAEGEANAVAYGPQHVVARFVTRLVIDAFEAIDVDEQDRERLVVPAGRADRSGEVLVHVATVV